jgi:hypothetical protein
MLHILAVYVVLQAAGSPVRHAAEHNMANIVHCLLLVEAFNLAKLAPKVRQAATTTLCNSRHTRNKHPYL